MGGAEKVLIDIVELLVDNHLEVEVLAFFQRGALGDRMRELCNVRTLFASKWSFFLFRRFRPYRRHLINSLVVKRGYDLAVGFMEGKPTSLLADFQFELCKIAWVHSDFTKLDIGWSEREMRSVYGQVDKVICVSKAAKQSFIKKIALPKIRTQVIYNLINEANITNLAEEKEITNDVFTFLTVGMLRKEKGHERLIRIAARLKKSGYDFQLHIIGDGPLRYSLEELIGTLAVEDRVTLLGLKENPYPYIKACDCFVLASDFEGYSIVVKEALFLKKLILTTDVVGPREILEDGKYGLIVELSDDALFDKMSEMLDGKNNYEQIRSNVNNYQGDNETIKRQLCELFS